SRPALDLPPPFRLVTLREVGDAFAHATRVAAEEGAGTLVYVGRLDLAEFAVVLEPEEPLKTARRALYAGLTALADALAVHAPPRGLPRARRGGGGARAAGGAHPFRRAGGGACKGRARRRGAPRLARARRRERTAGVAGVRRHDPHGGAGGRGTGPAPALGGARGGRFR